jgi:hypothetical protein
MKHFFDAANTESPLTLQGTWIWNYMKTRYHCPFFFASGIRPLPSETISLAGLKKITPPDVEISTDKRSEWTAS